MHKDPLAYSAQRTDTERQIADKRRKYEANQPKAEAEDPRIAEAQKHLGLLLADYRERNRGIDERTAKDMQEIVNDFVGRANAQGIKVPKLKLVYFVRMDHVCVWPAELEANDLLKRVHIFILHRQRHGRPVDANDMAMGVRRAYPDYSPSRHLVLPTTKPQSTQQETQQ